MLLRLILMLTVIGCSPSREEIRSLDTTSEVREAARREREDTTTAALRGGGADEGFLRAKAGYEWSFPRDHWGHDGYKTEWWYFTGHLDDAVSGQPRFAYQVTFFKVGLAASATEYDSEWSTDSLVMGHLALSDLESKEHFFSEAIQRVAPGLAGVGREPEKTLVWVKAPPGSPGRWELDWIGDGFSLTAGDEKQGYALSLTARMGKPLIFQGPGGLSRKGESENQASLYYSFTRLRTEGSVRVGGETLAVRGESWMDKEFGSSMLSSNQVGWDWFSLQLSDQSELMLYVLRDPSGAVDHASGTRIDAQGHVEYFDDSSWKIQVDQQWTSPRGGRYPVAWTLELFGRTLNVRAEFENQIGRAHV